MDYNIQNLRLVVLTDSSTKIHLLYNDFITSGTAFSLYGKYQLKEESWLLFVLLIGDIILSFYKIEDTVALLQQELELDAKTAALLGSDVLDFLAPLSDPNWQPPAEDSNSDEGIEIESAAPNLNYVTPIEPAQVETRVPEIRTMAGDILEERSPVRSTYNPVAALDEPMYQSSQPVIAKKAPDAPSYNAPLYQAPKPNVDAPLEKPRWG